jgi:hypothetical protein
MKIYLESLGKLEMHMHMSLYHHKSEKRKKLYNSEETDYGELRNQQSHNCFILPNVNFYIEILCYAGVCAYSSYCDKTAK